MTMTIGEAAPAPKGAVTLTQIEIDKVLNKNKRRVRYNWLLKSSKCAA